MSQDHDGLCFGSRVLAMNIWEWFLKLLGAWRPAPPPPPPPPEIWTLQGAYGGKPVTVNASRQFGGAIYSLMWGSFQFIDYSDHGRELQTAWQLDNLGEGENPTEAGAASDLEKRTSTTVLQGVRVTGSNVLETSATLAYWFPYGGLALSPDKLSKRVTLGYLGMGNVLHHEISIDLAGDHQQMVIEGLTAYLPRTFSRFFTYNVTTQKPVEMPVPNDLFGSNDPVISSTADGAYALGLWCTDWSKNYFYGRVGGIWPKLDTAWFIVPDAKRGRYSWDCFTVFGSLDDVANALQKLAEGHPPVA